LGLCLGPVTTVRAAEFTNLDFESANLPFIPLDDFGTWQPVSLAMPGWNIFIGSSSFDQVLHNNSTAGSAAVWIYGPATRARILEGNYSVVLTPGAGLAGEPASVSIAQTGIIPAEVNTLQFLAYASAFHPTIRDYFGVYIDGQRLQLSPAFDQPGSITATFTTDVSAFAGREVTLQFTSFPLVGYPNSLTLDNIAFINVPEPSTWALLGLGALALVSRLERRSV
jgi:hypothetical protein